ncbi:MAG: IPT/TIG domain-containing protein, partial [Planctomycetota bacterium]
MKKAKGSELQPILELITPDGDVEDENAVKSKASKSKAKVSGTLAREGRYALRVRSGEGSGDYVISFKVKPKKIPKWKKVAIAADSETVFEFEANGNAAVSWKMKFKGFGEAAIARLLDPNGDEIEIDEELVTPDKKGLGESAKDIQLSGPGGLYSLVVTNEFEDISLDLQVKVQLPKLKKEKIILSPSEPQITDITPSPGTCGIVATVTGTGFEVTNGGLFFGGREAASLDFMSSTMLQCPIPGGSDTVDIIYVASDGQVAVLEDAFTFNANPSVTEFFPTTGPGVGQTAMTISGSGFETSGGLIYEVYVGGVKASSVTVQDSSTITCNTPANVSGPKVVELRDNCDLRLEVPGTFTYGEGLFVSLVSPSACPTFGGIPMSVFGSNLSDDDTVFIKGDNDGDWIELDTTPIIFEDVVIGHRTDALPAHEAGFIDIEIRQSVQSGGATASKDDALAYYEFTDITDTAIPAPTGGDDWGGIANAVVDRNGDGTTDYILVLHDEPLSATRGGLRMLSNNGAGIFSDVTATKLPAATATEDFAGNQVLAGRLTSDDIPDLYLSRPGTGFQQSVTEGAVTHTWDEAKMLGGGSANGSRYTENWGRLLHADNDGNYSSKVVSGALAFLNVPGMLVCNATWACVGETRPGVCVMYDYDFRSVNAAMGDLDGDLDQDIVLINDESLADFSGLSIGTWVNCIGGGLVDYQYFEYTWLDDKDNDGTGRPMGIAFRILATGSSGGLTDRTGDLVDATPQESSDYANNSEDFRGVACTV